jgi:hypothetical protein
VAASVVAAAASVVVVVAVAVAATAAAAVGMASLGVVSAFHSMHAYMHVPKPCPACFNGTSSRTRVCRLACLCLCSAAVHSGARTLH